MMDHIKSDESDILKLHCVICFIVVYDTAKYPAHEISEYDFVGCCFLKPSVLSVHYDVKRHSFNCKVGSGRIKMW